MSETKKKDICARPPHAYHSSILLRNDLELHDGINRGRIHELLFRGDHTFSVRPGSTCTLASPGEQPPWCVVVTIVLVSYDATEKTTKISWRNERGFFVKNPNAYMPFAPGT